MTFLEMQEELSEVLAESGVKTFTAVARKRWLNEGVVEVCRRALCLKKKSLQPVTAGVNVNSLFATGDWQLTDFIEFATEGIIYNDGVAEPNRIWTPMERKTVEWLDENIPGWRMTHSSLRSDPVLYYARDKSTDVVYWPTPKTSVANGFHVYYHYFPIQGTTNGGMVANGDIPFNAGTTDLVPFLVPYHRLPVMWAGYRALFKAGVPKAKDSLDEFGAQLKNLIMEQRRMPDYEPQIRLKNYRSR